MSGNKGCCAFLFYSNDISWQAPGCKDRVIIRGKDEQEVKTKRTEQVQYMLMSLKEAYNKFKEIKK